MGCLQFVCFIDNLRYLYFIFTVLGWWGGGGAGWGGAGGGGGGGEDTDIVCLQ